jgi:hypothetical protein
MKKIFLPFVICIISFFAITSCTKEAKTPVATNVSSATGKTPTTTTTTTTQNQTPTNESGHTCHSGGGSGYGSSGSH